MNKRGQVTIFIIIAVIIVVGGILFFVLSKSGIGREVINKNIVPINDFVLDCLEETGNNALIDVGTKGGYAFLNEDIESVENIPYYLKYNRKLIPTKEFIENEISLIVREELSYCILNFKDLRKDYDGITHDINRVETTILDDKVNIKLNYPISVIKGESTYNIENFNLDFDVRLDDYYSISEEFISEQQRHLDSICLSCLYGVSEEYDVDFDMYDYGDSTIITIIDEKYKLNEGPYEWRFAIL